MVHNRRTRTGLTRNRANASRECLAVSRSPSRLRSSNPFLLYNNQSKTTAQSRMYFAFKIRERQTHKTQ